MITRTCDGCGADLWLDGYALTIRRLGHRRRDHPDQHLCRPCLTRVLSTLREWKAEAEHDASPVEAR